jgi:hypothetical protein
MINDSHSFFKMTELKWIERDTCWILEAKQRSPVWFKGRFGRLTASRCSAYTKRSKFKDDQDLDKLARQLLGLEKERFTPEKIAVMKHGEDAEPGIRDWFSKEINKEVKELGLAVWKKDTRMGASLDGYVEMDKPEDNFGVEIKAPQKLPFYLREGTLDIAKHFEYYITHYDQITMCGVILNVKKMAYVIESADGQRFHYYVTVDYNHFYSVLYPALVEFYDTKVQPLLDLVEKSIIPCPASTS